VDAVNVVALIPGSDPALRGEIVVYTAHYDHIGRGEPDKSGDSIYNGFSDNAAGVAMTLAIAEALRRDPPARSVAFLFLTGEERGLLGSTHAAAEPPWTGGLDRITALINLDGGAPPVPPISWRIAGGLAPDSSVIPLGALADSLARNAGWTTALETARPNSDYWPFADRGVPAIFIIPGNEWEGTTPEARDALRKRWDRYHQPGDEFREDFPFSGLKRYAEFALRVGRAAANRRW
jgi:Zn-dependent M28 family amino/carboxypeptidase